MYSVTDYAQLYIRVIRWVQRQDEGPPIRPHVYSVPCPNYLWHIDSNHKLIRWQMVRHHAVNRSVASMFFPAVQQIRALQPYYLYTKRQYDNTDIQSQNGSWGGKMSLSGTTW